MPHIMQKQIESALNPKKLGLILLPTEKCNFRCTYCYEDHHQGKMSDDIVQGIKNLLTNRASDLDVLNISWFGGEPLLNKEIILDILTHAKDLSEKNHFQFVSSMTTNGYFLDRDILINLGNLHMMDYQISLDGARDYHNTKRIINHPQGSFDTIWNNLLLFNQLRENGDLTTGQIMIRLHIHEDNEESLKTLATEINTHLNPEFFRITLQNISHHGGENDDSFGVIPFDSFRSKQLHTALKSILRRFVSVEFNDEAYICYAAKPNNIVIRSDGTLGKCTIALDSKANAIGRLTKEGGFVFEQNRLAPWLEALQTLDPSTLACPLSFVEKRAGGQ